MRAKYGLFLSSLLVAFCLTPFLGAQADASYGTRTYASYESITLTSSSSVAEAVDWLEDFVNVKVGGAMEIATDLMELVELNDANDYALASLDPADRPTTADIAEAFKSFENASDFNSEIRYYYDRLIFLYNQNQTSREQILSGELTPAEVDRLKLEMKSNDEETVSLMTVVINKQAQWITNAADIHGILDGLNTANVYIARIRNQAALVLADQADSIAAAEATAGVQPVVDVISDKEIAVIVTEEDGQTRLGNIGVTLNLKGQQGVTKVTNSNGTAIFWVADFKPNDAGVTKVEVTFDGTASGYQRRELGVMQLTGGDVFHMAIRKDNGKPYIVKATFDDADMLTVANGMYMTPKNDVNHTVELKVETKSKAVNVKAWYWKNSLQWETLLSENFASGDTAARTVTRKWVQKGGNGAFPEQKPIYLTITEGSGLAFVPTFSDQYEKDKTVFLGEKTKQEEPVSGTETSKQKTAKILDGFKFTLPSNWAIIGGAEIKIPLGSGFDYVMEIGKSLQLGYNYRVEKTEKSFWKSENLKQQEQRLKQEKDKNASILKNTANGVKNDYMAHRSERFLGSAKASVTPFLYVELEYNFKSNHAVGNIHVGTIIAFDFSLTRQFMIGPVPAFIGLELKLKLNIGVTVGLQADITNSGVPENLNFSGNIRVSVGVRLEISITVGAGLPRIAYIGLRGCGWINVDITLSEHSPDPVWQLGLRAQAIVKLLFFSKEWTFWQYIYPDPSGGTSPLLAAQWENSEASQTLSLEEAEALTNNLGAPNATASESDLIQQLPIAGGDVRYVSVGENLTCAFWIGRSLENSDQTRLLYYQFDPTSPNSGTMGEVLFGTLQVGLKYTYEFDVDVLGDNVYLIISSGNTAPSVLPDDSNTALEQMRLAQEGAHLFAGVWKASLRMMIDTTLCSNYGNNMRYVPRIRAITAEGPLPYYYAYGAINILREGDVNTYRIYTATSRLNNAAYVLISLNAADYHMPDYQLLNKLFFISDSIPIPYAMVLAQPKKSTDTSELYFIASASETYKEQMVPVSNLNFTTMSAPFWMNRSEPGSTMGFLMVKKDPDSSINSKSLKGALCTLFISNLGAMKYSDIRKSITIKDMDVAVSADGALPLSVNLSSSQPEIYAYWVQGQPGAQIGSQNAYADTYVIKACLIDMQNKLTSPPFTWISLEKKVEKLHLMPITDLTKPVVGYYLAPGLNSEGKITSYGVRKLSFQLQTGLRILSFSTDNSAVAQGKDFAMFFRLENVGSLVVKGANINVKAKKLSGDGDDEVLIKNIHIDMSDPQLSSVQHFDGLESGGRTTQGAYTVYRIDDVNDAYNGSLVVTHEYGPDSSTALTATERLKGMMPGNIATFKTNVTNSPTTWKGQYALYAEVVGINYTLALGSLVDADVGTVTRIDNPSGADTFTVTDPVTGTASGLFGYASPTPAEQSVQTNQVNNTTLNDTLTTGDARYADIGYNNLLINADTVWINGEEYAAITLDNSCNPASPLVTPMLVVRILNANGTYTVTYSRPLITPISDGFTRTLLIPFNTLLAGSTYYEGLKLSVEGILEKPNASFAIRQTVQSLSNTADYNLNDANSYDNLLLPNTFSFVVQPLSQTVEVGETATFVAEVLGYSGPYTYRWQLRYPDGSFYDVPESEQQTKSSQQVLTIPNAQLSQQGLVYWIMATDSSGRSLMSDTAMLNVIPTPVPATGDSFTPMLWIVLLFGSAITLWLLLRYFPHGNRRS